MVSVVDGIRITIVCVLTISVFGSPGAVDAVSQRQERTADISVVSYRPLADAILELETRYGWVVTYEDPFYEFQGDITEYVRRDGKRGPTIVSPFERTLRFKYQEADAARPQGVLLSLLNEYHAGGYDMFRLSNQGSIYHVVPSFSRNTKGVMVPRQSRLDARITLADGERTVGAMVREIVDEVARRSGSKITVGLTPFHLMSSAKVRGSAANEPARDVLVRTLAATGSPISWAIYCLPEPNECALNLQVVRIPTK
jgi:hypothetical protein